MAIVPSWPEWIFIMLKCNEILENSKILPIYDAQFSDFLLRCSNKSGRQKGSISFSFLFISIYINTIKSDKELDFNLVEVTFKGIIDHSWFTSLQQIPSLIKLIKN